MKNIASKTTGLLLSVFIFCSCVSFDHKKNATNDTMGIPPSLAGIWQSEDKEWIFKFEKNGTISKFRHFLAGSVDMKEGGKEMAGDENAHAVFIMGPCTMSYAPKTRELKVSCAIDDFIMEMPIGTLEGGTLDVFWGPVSKDYKTWDAKWRTWGYLKGSDRVDPNTIPWEPLKFEKVDDITKLPQYE